MKVKKVKAYPIPASAKLENGTTTSAQIMKLTYVGVLAEVTLPQIQAGDKLDITFELPVLHLPVHEHAVVIKLYNHFAGVPVGEEGKKAATPAADKASEKTGEKTYDTRYGNVMRIVEIHFKPLSEKGKKNIGMFLKHLGHPTGPSSGAR